MWLAGELGKDLADALGEAPSLGHVVCVDPVSGLRRAGQLARLASLHFAAGTCDAIETLQPLYLRNP